MKKIDFRRDLLPHKDRLYRLAMGILLDSAEAEDTVEDTLLRAWEETSEIQNLGAYLTTVCRNLAIDRSERHSARNLELMDEHDRADEPADADLMERYERTLQLIQRLPEPQRTCILLRDVEGMSYKEIAETLSLTEAQVKINIHRGRAAVREAVEQRKR